MEIELLSGSNKPFYFWKGIFLSFLEVFGTPGSPGNPWGSPGALSKKLAIVSPPQKENAETLTEQLAVDLPLRKKNAESVIGKLALAFAPQILKTRER